MYSKWLFVLLSLCMCSCNEKDSESSTSNSIASPTGFNSSMNAVSKSSASYRLVRLDGATPIDGTEDAILVCTPKMEYCTQTCISVYRPDLERWSVFKTDYLSGGGKCVGFAMTYSNGADIPKYKYWVGNYVQSGGSVVGRCSISVKSPTSEGRAYFDFVRPSNASAYYAHYFYDLSGNSVSSMRLLNFLPPAMWTYHDSAVSNADITPQLTNWSCIKESAIGDAFQ
jgi:hypothetical protein